ncbi:MAG: hypothetical protein L0H54_02220 [Alcaligenaceae bacterium]|nr:hypothetical protein [Alcaligenaceae bacterium]
MHYVIQILAAIMIGTSIGALLGRRTSTLMAGASLAIVLGIVTLFTTSWIPLALGAIAFLVAQILQRDPQSSRS